MKKAILRTSILILLAVTCSLNTMVFAAAPALGEYTTITVGENVFKLVKGDTYNIHGIAHTKTLVSETITYTEDGIEVIDRLYEYIPIADPSSSTVNAAATSGTLNLSRTVSYADGPSISAYASFDWNKDSNTVSRYNESYSISGNYQMVAGDIIGQTVLYIRSVETSKSESNGVLWVAASKSYKVSWLFAMATVRASITLTGYADGGYST